MGGLVGAKNLGYWSTEGIQFLKYLGEITFSTCFNKTALPSGASERHVRAYNIKIKPQKFKPHSTCVYITQEITNRSQQYFVQHLSCNKKTVIKSHSTTVIAKIKGMPRSLFYDIPCYVTMDYEK